MVKNSSQQAVDVVVLRHGCGPERIWQLAVLQSSASHHGWMIVVSCSMIGMPAIPDTNSII
jgi:hypothetical protein